LLDGHAVVDDVGHELGVRLRLVPPAHDAESDTHAVLLHEGRNQSVEQSLVGCQRVGHARLKREQGPTILQDKPCACGYESGAELLVVALNERDDVAGGIDDGEIDRVAALLVGDRRELGWWFTARGPGRVDQARARRRVRRIEHLSDGDIRQARVAHIAQDIGVGELLGLHHHVQRLRGVKSVASQEQARHDLQHHQGADPLAVGRLFVHGPAAMVHVERRHPCRMEIPEVLGGHRAAQLVLRGEDGLGRGARVESVTPMLRDASER
jgi:hypothetical protein